MDRSERKRGGNLGGERERRREPQLAREQPGRAAISAPPARSGDLPCRAKPLINAFAKKLHAVGGKQEQEGVGRYTRPALRRLASPRRAASVTRSRANPGSPSLSRSVRTFAANSIEILVQITRVLLVRARKTLPRDRARSEPHRSRGLDQQLPVFIRSRD